MPVVTSVSHATRAVRILGENRVKHRVGNLVGHLVRVALGHRFGREQVSLLLRALGSHQETNQRKKEDVSVPEY